MMFCLQGNYLSDLCVFEIGSSSWSNPSVVGSTPTPRGDTQMVCHPIPLDAYETVQTKGAELGLRGRCTIRRTG
jgi:hypothetical protein